MNKNMLFDFTVNEEDNTITVKRGFAAPVEKVWAAWTTSEILDKWWAPKPYRAKTKSMDFREGGFWLYAMIGPDGMEQYCRADYKSIDTLKSYSAIDAFCDSEGVPTDFPNSTWTNRFVEQDGSTTVDILIQYARPEDLEQIIEMGFKEGFTAGMNNLDEVLASS